MLSLNEDIYADSNIPYIVKGVWVTICATGHRAGNILFIPGYIKESKDFKFAKDYLEWCGKIKGVTDNGNIRLN